MGQGFSMTTLSAATISIEQPELSDLVHDRTLASTRFTKSARARGRNGFIFVKAVQKPYVQFDIRPHIKQIIHERDTLSDVANALGYQKVVEVGDAAFLIRQYMFSSVYDRLSTRPFLEDIERKWLAFQLLCAVRDSHARNVYHGDIKTENLLVTSWNWLYLTDYSAAFKPITLPEDNPADFFFFFDTSSRRICYIAPERFTNTLSGDIPTELNWAMDMFSIGCTIAELFLEGPIFTLSQIFKYRSGEYDPGFTHLNKIEDEEVRRMISNMIELDPEKRYSAEQHLTFYKGKIFPDYFYGFLHQYMQDLTDPNTNHRHVTLDDIVLAECDGKIDKVYQDLDKISYFLSQSQVVDQSDHDRSRNAPGSRRTRLRGGDTVRRTEADQTNDGALLFLTLISASLRSTSKSSARLKACDLLVAFAKSLPDEAKLDRILPYVAGLLTDRSDTVKVAALQALTTILDSVEVVSPINAYLFPEYILPRLKSFLTGPNLQPTAIVRAAYASCLASLAISSTRMLDMVQAIRVDGRISSLSNDEWAPDASFHGLYDVARAELVPHFEEATTALITDPDVSVRRALLSSVSRLCVFFGSARSSEIILSHLNTYPNDKDWLLRCSFFDALVGVALYIGSSSLERYILPIMVGALTDSEGFVVEQVFRSLSRMASLGLLQKLTIWELTAVTSRYLVHPSMWIRESAVQFIIESAKFLNASDRFCIIIPLLQPFLRAPVLDISADQLLDHLKTPLPRPVYEAAMLWAARREKSLFWTAASRDGVFVLPESEIGAVPTNANRRFPARIPPSQKDKDDQNALETLRNSGMTSDDEMKLLALREHILRVATRKTDDASDEKQQMMNNVVSLAQIGITPQNVFFDQREPVREVHQSEHGNKVVNGDSRRTLADALLDASTTIDGAAIQRGQEMRKGSATTTPTIAMSPGRLRPVDHIATGDVADRRSRPESRFQGLLKDERRASSSSDRYSGQGVDRLSVLRENGDLRRRGSALSLLNRAETAKSGAEASATPETAFGRLDVQANARTSASPSALTLTVEAVDKSHSKPLSNRSPTFASYEPNHSYTGNDANVLRLLDNHFIENFPIDSLEFGQPRPSADAIAPIKTPSDPAVHGKSEHGDANTFRNEPWKPSGQLLTQFAEHSGAINRVVGAPDHAFFVTISDDGTCKVWDTNRLEKNVNPRSKYTHRHSQGSKVKALCFVEGTHTFISGATDGSIHAVKIDYRSVDGGESSRYGKPVLVRDYQIPAAEPEISSSSQEHLEHAVWLHHYRTVTSQSVLIVATSHCRIILIDLKNMEILHSLKNPVQHGALTTFCVDRRHHWLLVGTTHGILDLWDLRFRLRLKSFGLGGASMGRRIERLLLHPTKGHGRWVIVSCGGEISVWDIEKLTCREVLRPSTFQQSVIGDGSGKGYEIWSPDEESSIQILERFAQDVETDPTLLEPQLKARDTLAKPIQPNAPQNLAATKTPLYSPIPALAPLTDYLANPAQPSNPNKCTILFSGGIDRTLRYWDLAHTDRSFIVSGPLINTIGDDTKDKVRVRYESSWPTSMSLSGLVQLVEEKVTTRAGDSLVETTPKKSKDRRGQPIPASSNGSSALVNKAPRSSIISAAQQQLLRTHMDGITDIIVLKKPYGCIVSVDRIGTIMVSL